MNNGKSDTDTGEKNTLGHNAYLSPLAVIALSFGYAVGWGSFVLPGAVFLPTAGPLGTIIGFLIGTVAVAVLAFNFTRLPHAYGGRAAPMALSRSCSDITMGSLLGGFCS